ncbi:hypothetical protein MPL1_11003 [Methylophaga lonarensis MPL]|uniref:Protein SlyX homolog n=1 Tax=Methylophaga lonarensis MPL TaxID=1286106 RepID=M7NYN0_9GAMM|nr:SlyX family protein [Methylophaga lonarensis]EMR12301.1 hypothetical protein MPL1_11003 [Methylophaga lonarensis MPL]
MQEDIIELQTRLAFQDTVIEELNLALISQQQQIDKLELRIEKILLQMEAMQQPQANPGLEPPPPHY